MMILSGRFRWARVGAGKRVHIVDPHVTMVLTLCGLGEATELRGQYVPERDGQVCRMCWSRYMGGEHGKVARSGERLPG